MDIFVFGSGAWGTALSILLAGNGHRVRLWTHDPEKAAAVTRTRKNPALPGVSLPPEVEVTADMAGAGEGKRFHVRPAMEPFRI